MFVIQPGSDLLTRPSVIVVEVHEQCGKKDALLAALVGAFNLRKGVHRAD